MRAIASLWNFLVAGLAYMAGVLFSLGALYITLDVLGRKFLGIHTGVTAEVSGYMLCAGAAWGMAYSMKSGGHVRIDVVQARFPQPWHWLTDLVALAVMGLFALVLAVYSWKLAIDSYAMDARALSVVDTPLVVPQSAMAVGFTLLVIEAVVLLLARLTGRTYPPGDLPEHSQATKSDTAPR